jgi:hypothetical protein
MNYYTLELKGSNPLTSKVYVKAKSIGNAAPILSTTWQEGAISIKPMITEDEINGSLVIFDAFGQIIATLPVYVQDGKLHANKQNNPLITEIVDSVQEAFLLNNEVTIGTHALKDCGAVCGWILSAS